MHSTVRVVCMCWNKNWCQIYFEITKARMLSHTFAIFGEAAKDEKGIKCLVKGFRRQNEESRTLSSVLELC